MEPRHITPKENTPLNRLLFAINHYVSTGDHIGEGVAVPMDAEGKLQMVLIPVNTRMKQDREDFEAFKARIEEIGWGVALQDRGREGLMHLWSLDVRAGEMDDIAEQLRAEPGPLGWGSMKKTIDKHDWK